MKIKFIKPFRLYNPIGDDMMMAEGDIENMEKEDYAKWLIDNGFAKEVKEPGWWKSRLGERYYYFGSNGEVYNNQWENDSLDNARLKLGYVFKTEEATERYRDYMEAVETVRHDEGFMKPSRKINYSPCGYGVYRGFSKSIIAEVSDTTVSAGEFYFDTHEHAKASVEAHQPEWETILDYDWSKGEGRKRKMKIKFIRPFRFIGSNPEVWTDGTVPVGHIVDLENDESAKWLINNGFAEKVGKQWPVFGDQYWYVNTDGDVMSNVWTRDYFDERLKAIGNVFKTKESAQRYVDYLKAVNVVSQDKGFMTKWADGSGWAICLKDDGQLGATVTYNKLASSFCFEWSGDAEASIEKHPDEWRTILDYDWSKGE